MRKRFVGGNMKKQVMIGLLGVLMISILPGCGKKKNDEQIGVGAPVNTPPPSAPPPPVNGGVGGCYDVRSIFGSGVTLGFSGVLQQSAGGLSASLGLYSTSPSLPGGYTNTYYRTTVYGDRVDVAINGTSTYVQASLNPTAVALAQQYGGQICGFYMNVSILNPAINGPQWSGNIGGGMIGVVTNGNMLVQL
jgi:hypothetical protein